MTVQPADDEKKVPEEKEENRSCARFHLVRNAHDDDIHAILPLQDGFVTGSKDGCLRKWSFEGRLLKRVYESYRVNYIQWITALGALDKNSWLSGTRDGLIDQWTARGVWEKSLAAPDKQAKKYFCKERNLERILCFLPTGNKGGFFCGRPTQFSRHAASGEISKRFIMNDNDWVYAMRPLKERDLLVITGPELAYLRYVEKKDEYQRTVLISEKDEPQEKDRSRLFISAMTPLEANAAHYGLAFFNGSVKVYDVACQKLVWQAQEHKDRVWTVENISPSVCASCADDGLIKLWDLRTSKKSILSITDNQKYKARVSVLLKIGDNKFVSGSCPDAVFNVPEKAQISFWDLRKG